MSLTHNSQLSTHNSSPATISIQTLRAANADPVKSFGLRAIPVALDLEDRNVSPGNPNLKLYQPYPCPIPALSQSRVIAISAQGLTRVYQGSEGGWMVIIRELQK